MFLKSLAHRAIGAIGTDDMDEIDAAQLGSKSWP